MTSAPPVQTIVCPACRRAQPGGKFCASCGSDMILNNAGPRYFLTRVLKQGGQGAVYEGVGEDGQVYAIKELLEQFADKKERDEAVARFDAEANFLLRLRHPGIPRVYSSFMDDTRHYLAMDFVRGEDLENRAAREGAIPEATVLEWTAQITDVLNYLHGQRPPIIFRDIKPSNIMLRPDGRIQLIDFGIAKVLQSGVRGTQIGTPGYAPPEQYQGLATAASDVYALCASLHHLLTGRDPQSEAPFTFPDVRTIKPAISERTARALAKGLQMRPEDRYQSIAALWADLNPKPAPPPVTTVKPAVPPKPAPSPKPAAQPAQPATQPAPKPAPRPPQAAPPARTKPPTQPLPGAGPSAQPRPPKPGPVARQQPGRSGRVIVGLVVALLVLGLVGATVLLLPGTGGLLNASTPTPITLVQQTYNLDDLDIIPPDTTSEGLRTAFIDAYIQLARQQYGANIQFVPNTITFVGPLPTKVRDDPQGPVYRASMTGQVLVPRP
ncbi:MAG TPA: serine/threonine-protein kinase [Roseiflexaceae bacterium]|nr:serine/threonine-protein kinase [Roseiflexaceae bacterium]